MKLQEISKTQRELEGRENNPNYEWARQNLVLHSLVGGIPKPRKVMAEMFPRGASEIDLTGFQLNITNTSAESFNPPFILKNSFGGWYHGLIEGDWSKLENAPKASNGFIGGAVNLTSHFVNHFTKNEQQLQMSGVLIKLGVGFSELLESHRTQIVFGPNMNWFNDLEDFECQNLQKILKQYFGLFAAKSDVFDFQEEMVNAGFGDIL